MSTASKKKISKKLVLKILASIVLVGGTTAYYLFSKNNEGEVLSWMSSSWAYRRGISVGNSEAVELTNEDVLIELDTASLISAGKMQNDCDDLRATDSDTTTAINYWIEGGCNTSATRIWVRIPTLPAIGSTIYFYYGNASAVNAETRWPIYLSFGDGADGDITIGSNTNINTTNSISGRSCADGGDAVNYSVTAFSGSTVTTATLSSTPSSGCLSAGDEVLIINLQGISTAYSNVGNYEIMVIDSISTNTITFTTLKTKYYGNGASDDTNIGTSTSNQRVMLQRIPNYNDVTVSSGYSFYPSAWNGTKGGVMMFKANGTVTVNGTIHANALGYRGGAPATTPSASSAPGEGQFINTTNGYGGNSSSLNGVAGLFSGGGGGGCTTSASCGTGGSGNSSLSSVGGGAGGSSSRYDSVNHNGFGGGGGGGGLGTYGAGGKSNINATNGSSEASGAGSAGSSPGGQNIGGGGGGGASIPSSNFTNHIYLGGGGGAGGAGMAASGGASYAGSQGGSGGGTINIIADTISVSGNISSNGEDGYFYEVPNYYSGGGGAGSGGSLSFTGNSITLGTSLVTATGGTGGNVYYTGDGGNGGNGSIGVKYITSSSGTTSPSSNTTQVSLQTVTEQAEETANTAPSVPTNLYTEGSTNPSKVTDLTPEFSAIYNDTDTGDTAEYYQIQVNTSSDFTGTEMWNSTKTSMTPTNQGSRSPDISYAGTSLSLNGTTYSWRIKFWDNSDAEGAWSEASTFIMSGPPIASSLLVDNQTNPTTLNSASPVFSAICTDPNGDNCSAYQINVNTTSAFDGTELWDTGKISTTITSGNRSSDITYHGTPLTNSENIYYWRIKFWDSDDNEGTWSSTAQFTDFYPSFQFEGIKLEGITIN